MQKTVQPGNVVKTIEIGNTTIKFCDDAYRENTPEQNEEIWKNVCRTAQRAWIAKQQKLQLG
ncbi:hypothetical protein ACFOQM_12625 [Paenibacillus sp. GCM10012307]|uniref:Uncharacterized protein n=1 Tax=Paenibacillus roseus TaxID=2798579 RepID=A0A934J822_9BACL|nr:hypothetical protein [Paenibacillus roseus]MBJ6362137.1 hypothetical protein [Paenibacillus roseus]